MTPSGRFQSSLPVRVGRLALFLLAVAIAVTSGHVHVHDHGHGASADLHAVAGHEADHDRDGDVAPDVGPGDAAGQTPDGHADPLHVEIGVRSSADAVVAASGSEVPLTVHADGTGTHLSTAWSGAARTPVSERTVIRT